MKVNQIKMPFVKILSIQSPYTTISINNGAVHLHQRLLNFSFVFFFLLLHNHHVDCCRMFTNSKEGIDFIIIVCIK